MHEIRRVRIPDRVDVVHMSVAVRLKPVQVLPTVGFLVVGFHRSDKPDTLYRPAGLVRGIGLRHRQVNLRLGPARAAQRFARVPRVEHQHVDLAAVVLVRRICGLALLARRCHRCGHHQDVVRVSFAGSTSCTTCTPTPTGRIRYVFAGVRTAPATMSPLTTRVTVPHRTLSRRPDREYPDDVGAVCSNTARNATPSNRLSNTRGRSRCAAISSLSSPSRSMWTRTLRLGSPGSGSRRSGPPSIDTRAVSRTTSSVPGSPSASKNNGGCAVEETPDSRPRCRQRPHDQPRCADGPRLPLPDVSCGIQLADARLHKDLTRVPPVTFHALRCLTATRRVRASRCISPLPSRFHVAT